MEIISTIALITINETLVIQIISFLIFMFIMKRIMYRPLNSVMEERDAYIVGIKQDISVNKKKVAQLTDQLNEREVTVIKEAFALKTQLEESSKKEASEISESTRKEISDLKETAQKEVDAKMSEAKKYLKEESEILATNIMEKILDRRLAR